MFLQYFLSNLQKDGQANKRKHIKICKLVKNFYHQSFIESGKDSLQILTTTALVSWMAYLCISTERILIVIDIDIHLFVCRRGLKKYVKIIFTHYMFQAHMNNSRVDTAIHYYYYWKFWVWIALMYKGCHASFHIRLVIMLRLKVISADVNIHFDSKFYVMSKR